jgi:hypothetical protein
MATYHFCKLVTASFIGRRRRPFLEFFEPLERNGLAYKKRLGIQKASSLMIRNEKVMKKHFICTSCFNPELGPLQMLLLLLVWTAEGSALPQILRNG